MIHELRIYEMAPATMPTYLAAFEKYALPLCRKHMRLLGTWTTDTGDLNRIYTLWAFENEDARRRQNKAMKSDPQFKEFLPHVTPILRSMKSILLIPNEFDGGIPLFQASGGDVQPLP